MKFLAAIPVFALLALGTATAVNAAPIMNEASPVRGAVVQGYADADYVPYHRCHGASAGTASPACGTATGGPSGSLF